MEKISWKNFGAIRALSAGPISGGGILLLVGGQGTGKSTALAGVTQRLAGQSMGIDLQPRDGTTMGELWIGEAKLTVHRGQKRNKGELEVSHIEGRFDISKLVDPGIKDPIAADQARIKALIALSGATANPSDFYSACDGQEAFDALGVDCDTTDPIVLAGRTSRALQAIAKKCKTKAAAEFAAAKTKHDEAGKVDRTVESDRDVLESAYHGAHTLVAELGAKQSQYTEQQATIGSACASLESLEPPAVSVEDAIKSLASHEWSFSATAKEIEKARADLTRAEGELALREAHVEQAKRVLKLTKSHAETEAKLTEVIASAQLEPITDDTFAAADRALAFASEAIELGVTVRAAEVAGVHAGEHQIAAEELQQRAETLRDQSRAVDEILSGLIPAGNLRIDEGRIVIKTDRSESELFAELSDGERAAEAIEIAVPRLPEDGLLIAPQWMWEGWTKSTQNMVWAKLKKHGVIMLTAKARDGELAVEVFEGTKKGE